MVYIIRSIAFLSLISLFSIQTQDATLKNPQVHWGVSERQGKRPSMEDAYCAQNLHTLFPRGTVTPHENYQLYGIFDGHGGTKAAEIASFNIPKFYAKSDAKSIEAKLKKSFYVTHQQIIKETQSGSTAVVALIKKKKLYIAWTGDSRAVLEKNGNIAYGTEDHKPDNPKERAAIEARGGFVMTWGVPRVQGQLAVARALGDRDIAQYITSEPEIKSFELTVENNFLILACDGVWDVLSNEQAVAIVKNSLAHQKDTKRNLPYEQTTENGNNIATQLAARALIDAAYAKGSTDNISALVISFDWENGAGISKTNNQVNKSFVNHLLLAGGLITLCYSANKLYHWII